MLFILILLTFRVSGVILENAVYISTEDVILPASRILNHNDHTHVIPYDDNLLHDKPLIVTDFPPYDPVTRYGANSKPPSKLWNKYAGIPSIVKFSKKRYQGPRHQYDDYARRYGYSHYVDIRDGKWRWRPTSSSYKYSIRPTAVHHHLYTGKGVISYSVFPLNSLSTKKNYEYDE